MPRAVQSVETQKFDLESCPEGYVVLTVVRRGEACKVSH